MKKTPGKSSTPPHKSTTPKPTNKTASKTTTSTSLKSTSTNPSAQAAHNGLRKLFEDQLKDIYWAEKALTKALPKMMEKASSHDLIAALESHLSVTEQQVSRCEEIFAALHKPAETKPCEAMQGLIKEANEIMEDTEAGSTRDAGIICAAQKVEHYEIATYGTLAAWARQLNEDEIAGMLEETLNEEKEADDTLSELAESAVNEEAMMEEDDNN